MERGQRLVLLILFSVAAAAAVAEPVGRGGASGPSRSDVHDALDGLAVALGLDARVALLRSLIDHLLLLLFNFGAQR